MNVITQYPAPHNSTHDLRFQAMFEGAAIGIGICRLDGRIVDANPALSRMLGYSSQELTGTHLLQLHQEPNRALHFDNFSHYEQSLAELIRGERDSLQIEKRYQRKDGSELWGHLTVSLARDAHRQPAFLVATLVDATEHKRLEDHLREAEKMEIIGRLAGGIAHDFNNLLTGVLLYCDLMTAELEKAPLAPGAFVANRLEHAALCQLICQHIDEVRMAGEQGAAMTQQLLAFARKQAAEPRPVLLHEIVASTENLLRRLIGEHVELVTALDSGAGPVLADPAQLRQVLLNLVLNARDAMPQGGKIRLITRAEDFPGESSDDAVVGTERTTPRRAVSLAVKDNGTGMNAETRARLFEPFFTTKKEGEGTGLGLATVQRIVNEAGGVIEVDSEPGKGTSIEVFFPAIESPTAGSSLGGSSLGGFSIEACSTPNPPHVAQFDSTEASHEISRKTILLVDDHAPARRSMQRILLDAGYSVLPAAGAKQALKVFAEHLAAVDMLIADCTMPGMNGPELAETLRRQRPQLTVLLISGYQSVPLETASGAVELIRKPFSGRALLDRVIEVCHRDAARRASGDGECHVSTSISTSRVQGDSPCLPHRLPPS
jgi:two-component system cell cycle sensor histidine kinase/response regulator CckA